MIAVLSSNFESTLEWMRREYKITTINISKRNFIDAKGTNYRIINEPEHAYGLHFTSMIKAPDFETLVDIVNRRIIPL